jgi:hypothetical protein
MFRINGAIVKNTWMIILLVAHRERKQIVIIEVAIVLFLVIEVKIFVNNVLNLDMNSFKEEIITVSV